MPHDAPGAGHYAGMSIEPIDYIEANFLDFNEGNVIKYVSRWRNKGGLEDLLKAEFYIKRIIALAKAEQAQEAPEHPNCKAEQAEYYGKPPIEPASPATFHPNGMITLSSGALRLSPQFNEDIKKTWDRWNEANRTFKLDFNMGSLVGPEQKTDSMGRSLEENK